MRRFSGYVGWMQFAAFAVLVGLVPATGFAQATFHPVGDLPGGPFVSNIRDATKVSGVIYAVGGSAQNAQVLCSTPNPPPNCVNGFVADTGVLWTWDGANASLAALPNLVVNTSALTPVFAAAITPDAAYIASRARSNASNGQRQAVRVTTALVPFPSANLNLSTLFSPALNPSTAALSISDNGAILYGSDNAGNVARFDAGAVSGTLISPLPGMTGSFATGRGTSSDGSVMVGVSFVAPFNGTNGRAFRYVHGSGVTAIPFLAGGTWNSAVALAPNGNLVVVGGNSNAVPNGELYLYNATTTATTALGSPMTPWVQSGLAGTTADGSVVITEFFPAVGGPGYTYFHNSHGWFHFTSALEAAGVDVFTQGWTELQANGLSPDGTLVFGFGFHNGNQEGFVAEFPAGFLAGFAAAPVAPGDTSIVGAWSFPNPDDASDRIILVLGADGTYYFIRSVIGPLGVTATPGFERGRYTWNASTHAIEITTVQDTNGDTGLDGANGRADVTFTVSGDSCVISVGVDTYAGTRITGGTGSVVGAWILGNPAVDDSSAVMVLLADGTYYFAQDGVFDGGGHDGIEKGTYSWNPGTGAFAATSIAVDTNGDWGLSNPSGPITLALSADGLTATANDGTGPLALTRAVDPVTFGRKSDILWRHSSLGEVWRWTMNGATQTAENYVRTVPDTNWEIRGHGDQNGDGQPDILWRNKVDGQIYFWPMNGSTPLGEIYVSTVSTAYDIVGTGDFDGDGKSDILWRNTVNGDVWIWLMNGATPLSEVYVGRVDPGYVVKGVGDLDGDSKADIVWHHGTLGDVWVWLMNGTTKRSETWVGTVPDTGYQIQGVADFTGDGKADLLWHHATRGEVWIWPMNGTTVQSETYVSIVPETDYRIVGTGDYDGDGKADLLWHHATRGEVWVWLMNGTAVLSENYVKSVTDTGYQVVKVK